MSRRFALRPPLGSSLHEITSVMRTWAAQLNDYVTVMAEEPQETDDAIVGGVLNVESGAYFEITNSSATSITSIINGRSGQGVTLKLDVNTTLAHTVGSIELAGEEDRIGPTLITLWLGADGVWRDAPAPTVGNVSLTIDSFPVNLRPVQIVDTLPAAGDVEGDVVFLTTDGKLYKWYDGAWVAAVSVDAADMTGQITTTQITDNAITTPKIAAGQVVTAHMTAGSIAADRLVANSITAGQIAAATITATELNIATLDAITANMGTLTAGTIRDTNSKFNIDLANRLLSVVDEQGSPVTRVRIGELDSGLQDWGIEVYDSGGDLILGATGLGIDVVGEDQIIDGSIVNSKLADGAVDAVKLADASFNTAKFAAGIRPVRIVDALPGAGDLEGDVVYLTTDGQLYRWHSGAWTVAVPTTALTGTIVQAQIADAAINTAKFAAGIRPVRIVDALPGAGDLEGDVVYLTTDNKMYRWDGSAWTSAVPTTDLTGTIAEAQIAAGAVTADKIAALAVTTAKIANDAVTATQLASAAVESAKIATSAVTTTKLADNAVTIQKLVVGSFDNLASNPGFEAGTLLPHDTISGGGSWTATTSNVRSGTYAAQYNSASQTTTARLVINGPLTNDAVHHSVTEGHSVYAEAWVRAGSGGSCNPIRVVLDWRNAAGTQISTSAASYTTPTTTYQRISHGGVAPAGTVYCGVRLDIANSGFSNTILIDDIYVRVMVGATLIEDGAVTTNKILADAVTADKILAGSITTAKIAAGAVTANEIGALAITTEKLDALAVTAAKIAAGAIETDKIAANAVTTAKLDALAVTADKIAANAITADKILAGSITTAKIAAGAIGTTELAAQAVTAEKIAVGTITATQLAAASVTSAKIETGAVTADKIAANSITAGQIASGAIGADEIAAGAVTTAKLAVIAPGSALNADPNFLDSTAHSVSTGSVTFATVADGKTGNRVLRTAAATYTVVAENRLIPVDPSKVYRVRGLIRRVGADGNWYLTLSLQDSAGANISGDGTYWFYWESNRPASALVDGEWTEFVDYFGPGTTKGAIPSNARTMRMGPHLLNRPGVTAGYYELQDFRIEEVLPSTLIANGAITTDKITANAITAAKIDTGAITAGKIAAGAVNAANIIVDGTITAAKLDVDELSAISANMGTITAGTIRDAASKMLVELEDRLITIIDEQPSPVTRVRIGELSSDTDGWGIEVNGPEGENILSATGLGVNLVGPAQISSSIARKVEERVVSGPDADGVVAVTFAVPFDNIPTIQLTPHSVLTGTRLRLQARDVTNTGFNLVAQTVVSGSLTAASDDFPTDNSLTTIGATTVADLNPGNPAGDTLTIRFDVSVTANARKSVGGGMNVATLTVAIDTDSGGGFVERATFSYQAISDIVGVPVTETFTEERKSIIVSGMASGSDVRLRVKNFTATATGGSFAVHGYDATDSARGVTYSTVTGETTDTAIPLDTDGVKFIAMETA